MAYTRTEAATEHLGRKNTNTELDSYGIKEPARVYWNLNAPELYEEIARRKRRCALEPRRHPRRHR